MQTSGKLLRVILLFLFRRVWNTPLRHPATQQPPALALRLVQSQAAHFPPDRHVGFLDGCASHFSKDLFCHCSFLSSFRRRDLSEPRRHKQLMRAGHFTICLLKFRSTGCRKALALALAVDFVVVVVGRLLYLGIKAQCCHRQSKEQRTILAVGWSSEPALRITLVATRTICHGQSIANEMRLKTREKRKTTTNTRWQALAQGHVDPIRMPNAKCQMPNAKCQMPNAKCQMPNANYVNPTNNNGRVFEVVVQLRLLAIADPKLALLQYYISAV